MLDVIPWESLFGGMLLGVSATVLLLVNGKIAGISWDYEWHHVTEERRLFMATSVCSWHDCRWFCECFITWRSRTKYRKSFVWFGISGGLTCWYWNQTK